MEKQPEAFIAVRKQRLRVEQSEGEKKVYLQDGQEYQIELFNPRTNPVLVSVLIDGNCVTDAGMVINPGQRVFLERYVNIPRKFQFKTYTVDSSNKDAQHAIRNNGVVSINFHDQEQPTGYYHSITSPWINPYSYDWWNWTIRTNGGLSLGSGSFGYTGNYPPQTTLTGGRGRGINGTTNTAHNILYRSNKLETGRTQQGSISDQQFVLCDGNFSAAAFHGVTYHLLPVSRKPVNANDIRNYCSNCGRRTRQQENFCPKCGEKL